MRESLDVEPVHVVFIGESEYTALRRSTVAASGVSSQSAADARPGTRIEAGTVCFVSLSGAQILEETLRLVRNGCDVFLDVPQLPAAADLSHLRRTADEAGVAVGISRPLRFTPGVAAMAGAASVAVLEAEFGDAADAWTRCIADTIDLSLFLCGSSSARRVEASFDRRNHLWPVFGAFSIRFDNGALAVAGMRQSSSAAGVTRCVVSRDAEVQDRSIALSEAAIKAETDHFLSCIAAGSSPAVSVADALAGARLLDHVLAHLR